MIILNWLMWLMFSTSLVISLVTIVVAYGIKYIPMFATLLPLEISLAVTFLLWGINSIFNQNREVSKNKSCYYAIFKAILISVFGGVLLVFAYFGIY